MIENPPILLLDTCIWLDIYLFDRPNRRTAQDLVSYALDHDVPLAFSSHTALDVYARVGISAKRFFRDNGGLTETQAKAAKAYAWDCVADMHEKATAVPIDSSDFYLAGKYRAIHDDYEDNLILATCSRARANYLVTNDRVLRRHADVTAKSADEMLVLLKAGLAHGALASEPAHDASYYLQRWLSE